MHDMRDHIKQLESKLHKKKEHKVKIHAESDKVHVEVASLMNTVHAQKEANQVLQRRIRELDEKNHHREMECHANEEKLGFCKATIDMHMQKLMEAAAVADAKRHAEIKKLEDESHKHHGHAEVHGDEHNFVHVTEIEMHGSYETSHSEVMKACYHNMKRMHDLD